ncbi:MAG TPA: crossover junction endodeoxyribonuclease RuvC, partial [Spirochaetota bacterium]|nr:crossover junction endodeoxyribonuclease RuvC [Spirochaetota bacterium]
MLLGIDPGLATTGFAVLNCAQRKLKLLDCGIITTSPHESLAARLKELDNSLHEIIISYSIKHAAVEKLYFNKNIKTCLLVAHCRGVILN